MPEQRQWLIIPFLVELVDESILVVTPCESAVAAIRELIVSFSSGEQTRAGGSENDEYVLNRGSEVSISYFENKSLDFI